MYLLDDCGSVSEPCCGRCYAVEHCLEHEWCLLPPSTGYPRAFVIPATEKQIVTGDNTMTGGVLWLLPAGDITLDGRVDIFGRCGGSLRVRFQARELL